MAGPLRDALSPEQGRLLEVVFESFDGAGEWPFWQYVDLVLDQEQIDAGTVLASLPVVGERGGGSLSYGLIRRTDPYMRPRPEAEIALTIAGMRHLTVAEPLLGAFLTTIRFLVEKQRMLVPERRRVVEAMVKSRDIGYRVLTASQAGTAVTPNDAAMDKLRVILTGEPFLYNVVNRPNSHDWEVKVPAVLREYRAVETIEDYVDRVADLVAPAGLVSVPLSIGALDLPYAVGYLDAVWKSRTGEDLFVSLDPASVARLTRSCDGEEEFNSLMSALADVLGQVVTPGKTRPPQRRALEEVRDHLSAVLEPDAAVRAATSIGVLIRLRHIRVSSQHADARHKAVAAFQEIHLAFPPPSWAQAWEQVATMAKGALDALREEIQAGLRA